MEPGDVRRRKIRPGRAIDLRLTVGALRHGGSDPTMRIDGAGVWRATRGPEGPTTVHLQSWGAEIEALAWGPGATWALEHVPAWLGMDDDREAFAPTHPRVRELHRRFEAMRLPRTGAVVEALIPTILQQKVISLEANRSYARLVRALSLPAPGPRRGLYVPPDPARVAATPGWAFHPWNVELKRADTVRRAAKLAARLDETATMSPLEATARLQSVPGIGPWTAASVVRVALGDPDAVVVGDYHLPHVVSFALAGEPRGTDDRMLELLEPFRGHRGRVQRLLVLGVGHAPRYGPRLPLRSISRQ